MARREFRQGNRKTPEISQEHAARLYWALKAVSKRIDDNSGQASFTADEHLEIESAVFHKPISDGWRAVRNTHDTRRWEDNRAAAHIDGDDRDDLGHSPD